MRRLVSSKEPAEVRGGKVVFGLAGMGLALRVLDEACSPGRRSELGISLAGLEEMPGLVMAMGGVRLLFSVFAIAWDGALAAMVTGFVIYRKQKRPAMAVLAVSIQG